jgi:alginate O-acetyltransferase complex protein AlgI
MVFSSPIFMFLFLPVTFLLYALAPYRLRNTVLLAVSILFYAWGERLFVLVMLASILLNWLFGLALERYPQRRNAQLILALAVAVNIGLLGFYKYSGFIVASVNDITSVYGWPPIVFDAPHLPLGISFFTFHALSYVIDVYRKDATAQRNPINFSLYISFFPQLIAGPIIRYHDIYKQLDQRKATVALIVFGIERAIAGLGKKVLLANPMGELADGVFSLPASELTAAAAWLGVVAYTLQIYLDFSGYSDMAIGLARIFSFDFLENFNYPYLSQSIQEFWRRWHISLSNWFRDYLYIPLGGNQVAEYRVWFNLVFVFFVCGLWHGANWTFVVWGLFHGLFLVLERLGLASLLLRLPSVVRRLYVLLVVGVAWVFFRAPDIGAAGDYLATMFGLGNGKGWGGVAPFGDPLAATSLVLAVLASAGLFTRLTSDWTCRAGQSRGELHPPIGALAIGHDGSAILLLRFVLLIAIVLLAAARIAAGTYNPFIYFRF